MVKITKGDLKIGDSVKLTDKNDQDFTQVVSSMQIERAAIDIAKKGDEFGLKTEKEVKKNSTVYKAS